MSRLAEVQTRFPAIIGQPRFRGDVFSRSGWWQSITDGGEDGTGDWWWPIECFSTAGAGDCPACSGIPFWSKNLAEGIENWLFRLDMPF